MLKFLSCDWGTSSFRLRLMNTSDRLITHEYVSDLGIQRAFKSWTDLNAEKKADKAGFYLGLVGDAIKKLEKISGENLEGWMIICSGMASSSIGIKELPYSKIPFNVSGQGMEMDLFSPSDHLNHPLILISGLQNDHNVMRGEETQLIGVIKQLEGFQGKGIFIFPGTHSKHIEVTDGMVSDFSTYMTGEVFTLLGKNSILSNSIEPPSAIGMDGAENAFEKGVLEGANNPLLSVLFNVRTNDLFGYFQKKENYHYLSGLLIGNELRNLINLKNNLVYLCSEEKLYQPYAMALKILKIETNFLSPKVVAEAVVHGQFQIFNQNLNHERGIFLGSF